MSQGARLWRGYHPLEAAARGRKAVTSTAARGRRGAARTASPDESLFSLRGADAPRSPRLRARAKAPGPRHLRWRAWPAAPRAEPSLA